MAHRIDCPTDWEARRRGESAFESGLGSWRNPYKSDWPNEGCPEAATQWERGYRDAERREDERRQEEEARHYAMERHAEQEALEQYEIEKQYEEPPMEQSPEESP